MCVNVMYICQWIDLRKMVPKHSFLESGLGDLDLWQRLSNRRRGLSLLAVPTLQWNPVHDVIKLFTIVIL